MTEVRRCIDPILGVAKAYIDEYKDMSVSADQEVAALRLIFKLMNHEQRYDDCVSRIKGLIGSSYPVERIFYIMQIAEGEANGDETKQDALSKRSRVWTTCDDNRLLAGIYKYGIGNWKLISSFVGNGKSRSQCSQRWTRALNPLIIKQTWTHEEDRLLLQVVSNNGPQNWSRIAKEVGTRSDVQCRYRYLQLMKPSPPSKEEEPMSFLEFGSQLFVGSLDDLCPPLRNPSIRLPPLIM